MRLDIAYIIGAEYEAPLALAAMSMPAYKLKQARERLQRGDIAGAQALCEQVLRSAPRNPDALCLLGIAHLMQGRAAAAVPPLEQAVSADSRDGMALEHLGLAYLMLGRFADAEAILRRAHMLPDAPPSVAMRLGIALLEQDKFAEAIARFRQSLARDPGSADCRLNLGQALARMGESAAAREQFDAVLRLDPTRLEAAFNLGVLELQAEKLEEARHCFERVLAQAPQYVDAMASLGIVFHKLGRHSEARERFRAALHAAPAHPAALEGMAFLCLAVGRTGEAIDYLETLLATQPNHLVALAALANARFELGQLDQAATLARGCCERYPAEPAGYATLANVEIVRGALDRAIVTLEGGYTATASTALLGMLTYQLRQACDWPRWRNAWHKLAPEIEKSHALGSPFWLLCEPTTAQQQLDYTQRWAAARFMELTVPRPHNSPPRRHSRIRVGYLSSDLQEHAAAYLIAEVLELHDRERFEIFAYSHGPDDASPMRQRVRAACEQFIDIAHEPDDIAAERIRRDDLDVLVDLKGYTAGDRLTIMARRPCDVQVTWLGYPGTTGAQFMDYLIADPFLVPPGQESAYSERIVRMPHCYQPNDRRRPVGAPLGRAEYGIPENAFVFCCFNQPYKITPEIFGVWMRLLRDIPESVLWLVETNRWARDNLLEAAKIQDVSAERLIFAPRVPYSAHLARYRAADLALDTFPYTSHTILSDALWCGCPTVALCGETFASRVSGSLLTAAGLSDLIAYDLTAYERLARGIAVDAPLLAGVRARVAQARDHSPLFDSKSFTRDLEEIYMDLANERAG